jgi:hypothetical protein
MKWSFIEWIMVQNSIMQHNEVEKRRVAGIFVPSTTGKSAFFKYASNGLTLAIENSVAENRAYRIDALKAYDSTTILEYVRTFVRSVFRMRDGDLTGMKLYMNGVDVPDFREAYRKEYGANNDYNGEKSEVKDFALPEIVGLPNMGNSQLMFIAAENSIEFQENEAGEGLRYEYQLDLEELIVTSYKKEGTMAFAGRKFANKAALIASKGIQTNIFVNYPVTVLAAGATAADATANNMFETVANAGATSFLDFTGAVQGTPYTIFCGDTPNATAIAKAAKFSEITEAWTPTAVGDFLKVIFDPTTSKFLEYSRKVGGTTTLNANLLAPEYVESI